MTRHRQDDFAMSRRRVARPQSRAVVRRPRQVPSSSTDPGAESAVPVNPIAFRRVDRPGHRLRHVAWLLGALGLAGVALAVWNLARHPAGAWLAGGLLVLAVAALAAILARTGLAVTPITPGQLVTTAGAPAVGTPGVLVFFATMATLVAAIRRWEIDRGPAGWDVGAPWLAGLFLFTLVAWWPALPSWLVRLRSGTRLSGRWPTVCTWAPWLGLVALAAFPRLVRLDRYPAFINGDEGQYLLMAVSARDGAMANPFATGWLEVPHLYPAVQGWLATVTGAGLAGYRVLSGLVGVIGVLATWWFGRSVVGPWPALAGAGLMAALPFHLLFSRSAMNHALDPASLALALLFLRRCLGTGCRGDAFLAGVMVGIGWYGYWGARVFPLIVLLILAVFATDRRVGWRNAVRWGGWSALGFVVTAAPLLVTFAMAPEVFRSRFEIASPISAAAWGDDPAGVTRLFLENLRAAIFFPFVENWQLFFRHRAPFFGWPVALLIAIGAAAFLASLVRARTWREGAWLLAPWAVLTAGLATTEPLQSQRIVALIPVWMLLAGCGAVALAGWVTALGPLDRPLARQIVTVGIVLALAISNLAWMTSGDRQLAAWGDPQALAAWDIGWRLANGDAGTGPGPSVLMAGHPVLYIDDWGSLRFLAPNADVLDLEGAPFDPAIAPALLPGTLLLLVPERAGERCDIEAVYPGITVAEVRAHDGTLLYLAFYREPLGAWATGSTPEGTAWAPAAAVECAVGTVGSAWSGRP